MTSELPSGLRIKALAGGAGPEFYGMTFPRYRGLLPFPKLHDGIIVAAHVGDEPAGLILGQQEKTASEAQLLSIFVKKEMRHRGIGTELLSAFEDECRKRAGQSVSLIYSSNLESAVALERLLAGSGWSRPRPRMAVGRFERDRLDAMRWIWRYELPEDHTVSPWHTLADADRAFIRSVADSPNWHDSSTANPFSEPGIAEPLTSLLLKKEQQIIGWVVTHRINPDTIRYTHLFVRQDLQAFGLLLPLFAESLRRHRADGPKKGIFAIYLDNDAFVTFLHRRIEPHLLSLHETREMRKQLG